MSKSVVGRRMRSRDQSNTYLPPDIRGAVVEGRIARRRMIAYKTETTVASEPKCDCGAVENGYAHAINCPAYYANAVITKRFSSKEPNEANRPRERDTLEHRTKMSFAWVIERDESESSRPQYFTGKTHPAMRWSDPGDHLSAIRFARKVDAERMALIVDGARQHRVAEHGWEE
jgi:hypothetical protein